MTRSMTGYGKATVSLNGGRMTVEVKSLNGKGAEIGVKTALLPRERELEVRAYLSRRLVRGNIDLFMTWEANAAEGERPIDMDLAAQYYDQLKELNGRLDGNAPEAGRLLPLLLSLPGVLDVRKKDVITEENWPEVFAAIEEAADALDRFRVQEGQALQKDLRQRVDNILQLMDRVEAFEGERIESVRKNILDRFEQLSLAPAQDRLEQEMIYYLEKLDINEEKVRLRQHCRYFMETLLGEENCGRKLGFIAQEMGREINTTGSKSSHAGMQECVIRMKDELEKIKEQSLNVL